MLYVFWQFVIIAIMYESIRPSQIFSLYLRDKLLAGFYQESIVKGRIRCAYSCFIDAQCYGVAYHKFRKVCYFYNDFPKCDTFTVDNGMATYLPKGSFFENIALNKPVKSSSKYRHFRFLPPCSGVDGNLQDFVHTWNSSIEWWCVDLERIYNFQSIVIYNRGLDIIVYGRIQGFELRFSNNGNCNLETFNGSPTCYKDFEPDALHVYYITSCNQPATNFSSRFIFLSPRSNEFLNFREFVVM